MKLLSNWHQLLISQIMQGTFFMSPQMYVSMIPQFEKYLAFKSNELSELDKRSAFDINARSSNGDSHSLYDEAPEGSVAVIPIKGAMLKYGTWWQYGMLEIAAFARAAIYHKNISAIVLDIDSGGGGADAIACILQIISEAKAQGKVVVAKVDTCCSAAYYVASACDWIIADNTISSMIGSIGVMASYVDLKPYYEKEGIVFHDIYADESNHKNQPFIMAMKGEYELIKKEWMSPMAIAFQNHVKTERASTLDESVEGIIAGKVFFAEDALKHGLIDEIGDEFTAIEKARLLAEGKNLLSTSNYN
ncbi:MAG: S49 family peptidase [Reichenbachiella sp.]